MLSKKGTMKLLVTLLTSHKGVDLHAATAMQVMVDRLAGGRQLSRLLRCEIHTFAEDSVPGGASALLETGRYYNPNKHHFGVFEMAGELTLYTNAEHHTLPSVWPGKFVSSDVEPPADLYTKFLGGPAPAGQVAVDVATFVRGQNGPVFSGVLWRLVLAVAREEALELASHLSVARGRKEGLLLNPHLEEWLLTVR